MRIFSVSMGYVYQKKLTMKGCNAVVIVAVSYTMLSLLCIPLMSVYGRPHPPSSFYYYGLIVGLLGALGNGFMVKALKKGELSVLGPINSYKAVLGLFIAMIVLREMPGFAGIIGIILIVWGSYFVLDTMGERFTLALLKNKEIQYRFLALFFCSIEAVFIKKMILLSSVWDVFVAWCFFGALFYIFLLKFEDINVSKIKDVLSTRNGAFFISIAICVGIMQYTTNYIFERMNVAYALALFQLSAVVSVVLGHRIFAEKEIFKKTMGSLIMIAGAVLIVLYN